MECNGSILNDEVTPMTGSQNRLESVITQRHSTYGSLLITAHRFQVIVMVQATIAMLIDVAKFTWLSISLTRLSAYSMDAR